MKQMRRLIVVGIKLVDVIEDFRTNVLAGEAHPAGVEARGEQRSFHA
jgi:hypothetical protein